MDVCPDCLTDLPWLPPLCRHCAEPLNRAAADPCPACAQRLAAGAVPLLDGCIAAVSYEFPVDWLIAGLKFRAGTECARVLAELLRIRVLEAQGDGDELPDILLPVPLHHWRLARRGFNQAEEIGRQLAADLGLPLVSNLAARTRHTPSQAGLPRSQRLHNLSGAFAVTAPVARLRIALLDDVLTTLATVRELAACLKRAGAAEVYAWAPARTSARAAAFAVQPTDCRKV